MSSDDFEKRVQHQPLRQVPAEWRTKILRTAAASAPSRAETGRGWLNHQLTTLLWLKPKAWAALAAVWLAILALNFYATDKTTLQARKVAPPPREMIVVWQNQRRELAKLVQPAVLNDADKPRPFRPGPRSEGRSEILAV